MLVCMYSANILLDDSFHGKLGDFGFSIEVPKLSSGRTVFTSACIARTEGYYASEITAGKYSDRSDVYSFGVVRHMTLYNRAIIFMILFS